MKYNSSISWFQETPRLNVYESSKSFRRQNTRALKPIATTGQSQAPFILNVNTTPQQPSRSPGFKTKPSRPHPYPPASALFDLLAKGDSNVRFPPPLFCDWLDVYSTCEMLGSGMDIARVPWHGGDDDGDAREERLRRCRHGCFDGLDRGTGWKRNRRGVLTLRMIDLLPTCRRHTYHDSFPSPSQRDRLSTVRLRCCCWEFAHGQGKIQG
jgi:hypothetical protein